MEHRWTQAFQIRRAGVYYALIAMAAAFSVLTATGDRPNYLRGQNVANILDQSSLIGILAIFAAVVLISGNFDLSVGSVAALSGAVLLSTADEAGLPIALLLALLVAISVGLLNGLVVQKLGINAFIVTLGTLVACRGLVNVITDGRQVTVESRSIRDSLNRIEGGFWETPNLVVVGAILLGLWSIAAPTLATRRGGSVSVARLAGPPALAAAVLALVALSGLEYQARFAKTAWYLIVIMLVVAAVLRFTVVGRRLYASGGNAEAARLSGIRVDRYKIGALIASSTAAGVVGILFASKLGSITIQALVGSEFTAITAAVLGGVALFGGSGNVVKAVAGTLILFGLTNGFNVLNFPSVYQDVIEGVVIIVAAAVYTLAERRTVTVRIGGDDHDEDRSAVEPAVPERGRATVG